MKKFIIVLSLLFLNFSFASELNFGVYTSDKPTVMYKKFKPIIDYLEKDLQNNGINKKIKLKIYPTYESAINGLVKGEYDFARFGPASYILAKDKNKNIKLLVQEIKNDKKRFKGVFITKSNSGINRIEDLKGKSFAFGNDNSTIGRFLSQAQMLKRGIDSEKLVTFKYLQRHDKVALAVANGDFDAGVIKESTFKKYKDKGIRSFHTFDNVTKPWLVRENFPKKEFEILQNTMINLRNKEILTIFKGDGFIKTNDDEYDFVREGINLAKKF